MSQQQDVAQEIESLEREICRPVPLRENPYWTALREGWLSKEQIITGDTENARRAKIGQPFRIHMLEAARTQDEPELYRLVWEVVNDEIFTAPDHHELRMQMLRHYGLKDEELKPKQMKPFTAIAVILYRALAHSSTTVATPMIGAGIVEKYYAEMSTELYRVYLDRYGFSEIDAKTYEVHSTADVIHSKNAIEIATRYVRTQGELNEMRTGIILAWVATHFLYLGMLQASSESSPLRKEVVAEIEKFLPRLFDVTSKLRLTLI